MTAEQEFFLYELETTDSASIGLVLRAIYDSGNVHKFARALERRIAHYDKNILKVCTFHYQGFLDSVSDLGGLRERSERLKAGPGRPTDLSGCLGGGELRHSVRGGELEQAHVRDCALPEAAEEREHSHRPDFHVPARPRQLRKAERADETEKASYYSIC